ncbi:MAG TPA: glycosyltransferase family 87 protein [Vicinamibacterales bacterium]|nr:glycosyltransferase family 87 protein [Vicinamibacterales bacterium]
MLTRLRPLLWPLLFIVVAAILYRARVERAMVDFEVYRTAAQRALHAEPLYQASDGHYQFKYLPAFALAMAPFALVDHEGAKVIWFALSAGLLTAFLRWSVRALPERRRSDALLLTLTVVLMAKFYAHELVLGQTNILLGVVLLGALLAAQMELPRVAGALIGAAAFIKPYALLLLPWIAFTYGVGAAVSSVGVLAAGLLLPAAVYGWHGNLALLDAWYRTVTGTTTGNLLGADNVSLAAMWAKWLGIGTAATALATITTGAALGLVATVWVRRRQVAEPDYLEYALLMLLVPLVSPQGWDYVLLLGTPAVIVLLDRWSEVGVEWRTATGVSLALMGLTLFDVMGRALYGRFMALSVVTVAAIGAAVALTHLRWRALG